MDEGSISLCPIHADVRTYKVTGEALEAQALVAGWPCQVQNLHHVSLSLTSTF